MTPPVAKAARVERLDADLVSVRERLARLDARVDAHDEASVARHQELVAALEVEKAEARAWKLAMGLAPVGAGGGAGSGPSRAAAEVDLGHEGSPQVKFRARGSTTRSSRCSAR